MKEWQSSYLNLGICTYFLKNRWSEPITSGKTTDSLLPRSNSGFQGKIRILENIICHYELGSFSGPSWQYWCDINKCVFFLFFFFCYCIIKCVSVWKICLTWWASFFQLSNAWYYKIMLWVKDLLKYKID